MKKVHFNLERENQDCDFISNNDQKENRQKNINLQKQYQKDSYTDFLLQEKNKEILSLRDKINSLMEQKLSLENKNKNCQFRQDEKDYNNDLKLKEKEIEIIRLKNQIQSLEDKILENFSEYQKNLHTRDNEIQFLKQQVNFLSDNLAQREKELLLYEQKKQMLNERSLDKMTELRIKNRIIFHTENLFIIQHKQNVQQLKNTALRIWIDRFRKRKDKNSLQNLKKYTLKWKDIINQNLKLQIKLGQGIFDMFFQQFINVVEKAQKQNKNSIKQFEIQFSKFNKQNQNSLKILLETYNSIFDLNIRNDLIQSSEFNIKNLNKEKLNTQSKNLLEQSCDLIEKQTKNGDNGNVVIFLFKYFNLFLNILRPLSLRNQHIDERVQKSFNHLLIIFVNEILQQLVSKY